MTELYNSWLAENVEPVQRDKDPFWDPVEDIFVGRYTAHKLLFSLCYFCLPSCLVTRSRFCISSFHPVHSCHVWLNSLAYCLDSDDQVALLNHRGKEEGRLHVQLLPCDSNGK